jgi:hypothetical protein
MVNLWKRGISITPTWGIAATNNSGCCVIAAPISRPPLPPPLMASLADVVTLFAISHFGQLGPGLKDHEERADRQVE